MTITHTNGIQKVTFKWNDDLSICDYIAAGVEDNIVEQMIAQNAHEGQEYKGFTLSLDL